MLGTLLRRKGSECYVQTALYLPIVHVIYMRYGVFCWFFSSLDDAEWVPGGNIIGHAQVTVTLSVCNTLCSLNLCCVHTVKPIYSSVSSSEMKRQQIDIHQGRVYCYSCWRRKYPPRCGALEGERWFSPLNYFFLYRSVKFSYRIQLQNLCFTFTQSYNKDYDDCADAQLLRRNISVFSRPGNCPSVSDVVLISGGPATEKLHGPKPAFLVGGTTRSPWPAECNGDVYRDCRNRTDHRHEVRGGELVKTLVHHIDKSGNLHAVALEANADCKLIDNRR